MGVTSVTTAVKTASTTSAASSGISGLNGGEFMQILLAQLRNQNPLEPMDDQQLIGQMTQLNSLEELQKINATLEKIIELNRPDEEG